MAEDIESTFYVTFDVVRSASGRASSMRPKAVTQNRPTMGGAYTLRFHLVLPTEAIEPETVEIRIESPNVAIAALQKTAKDLSE